MLPSSVKHVIVAAGAYNADYEPDRCFSQLSNSAQCFLLILSLSFIFLKYELALWPLKLDVNVSTKLMNML